MVNRDRKRMAGLLMCIAALSVSAAGWASFGSDTSTDNAYIRGEITSLAPRIAGYVTAVEVEDNQTVEVGDILFRIEGRDHAARLAQATANVEAAKARLMNVDAEIQLQHALIGQAEADRHAAVAELALASKASDRRHALIRTSTISQAQVDESDAAKARAKAEVLAASANLEAQQQRIAVLLTQRKAAEAGVDQADAARDLAQIDFDSTIVRAPVSGVIGHRQVRVGRLVAPGVSLLDIVPVQHLWVVANFKETQIEGIRTGQRARIQIDGYHDQTFAGVVDSIAPGSGAAFSLLPPDNATGNFVRVVQRVPVKIRFAAGQSPAGLVPGLSARVEIVSQQGG